MSVPGYSRFLSECITHDPERHTGLRGDELYGVYISWCLLNREEPGSSTAFWVATKRQGYGARHRLSGRSIWPGLAMTGPAAVASCRHPAAGSRRSVPIRARSPFRRAVLKKEAARENCRIGTPW